MVLDHKSIKRKYDHNLLVWCIQLLLYAVSYFRSTHGALFSQAMISLSQTLNVTTSWVFITIIKINYLVYIFWNCALNSIIFAQLFCECQTTCWQQAHMWLSYRCIFLLCHMIGEQTHIHLLYFSEFRDLVLTLVDQINLSQVQVTYRILEEFQIL